MLSLYPSHQSGDSVPWETLKRGMDGEVAGPFYLPDWLVLPSFNKCLLTEHPYLLDTVPHAKDKVVGRRDSVSVL